MNKDQVIVTSIISLILFFIVFYAGMRVERAEHAKQPKNYDYITNLYIIGIITNITVNVE